MKADGGRINFRTGGPTGAGSLQGIIGADLPSSGLGLGLGSMRGVQSGSGLGLSGGIEEDEFEDIRGQTAGLGVLSTLNKIFGPTIGQYVFNRTRDKVISKGIDVAENATKARRQAKQAKEAAEALAKARVQSITAGYGGYDDSPGATGPTAAGAGMGVGGGYATDYGFAKGGLATMFTRKR